MSRSDLRLLVALALVTAACPQGNDSSPPARDSAGDTSPETWTEEDLTGRCVAGERAGSFGVGVWDGMASILGQVWESVLPQHQVAARSTFANCEMVRPPSYFCDPACQAGDLCVADDTCAPYPASVDLGTVTIRGLTAELALQPDVTGAYWDASLEPPLLDKGDLLEVSSDLLPDLHLRGVGVAPLDVVDALWAVQSGTPLTARWVGVDSGQVELTLMINQHGLSPSILSCITEDVGEMTVPAEAIDALIAEGASGLPAATLRRFTADHVDLDPGCVDLEVYDHRNIPVEVTTTP